MKEDRNHPQIGKLYQALCSEPQLWGLVKTVNFNRGAPVGEAIRYRDEKLKVRVGSWVIFTRIYTQEEMCGLISETIGGFTTTRNASEKDYRDKYLWVDVLYENKVYERVALVRESWKGSFWRPISDNESIVDHDDLE